MHLEIDVRGLKGRKLELDMLRRWPLKSRKPPERDDLPYQTDLSTIQLISESKELALKPAIELFRRFGWDPSLEILRDIQGELFRQGSHVVDRG